MKFNAAISFLVFTSCFCISTTTTLACSCSDSIETGRKVNRTTATRDHDANREKDVMQLLKETNNIAEKMYSLTKDIAVRKDKYCNKSKFIGQVKPGNTNKTFGQILKLTIYTRKLFGKSDDLTSNLTRLLCNYELMLSAGVKCPVNKTISASKKALSTLDKSQENDSKFQMLCDILKLTANVTKHLEKNKEKSTKPPKMAHIERTTDKEIKKKSKQSKGNKKGAKSQGRKLKKPNRTSTSQ